MFLELNENMGPKVSVVIPIYNGETYLKECLDSIVNQTLYDIEIICVNDGSTDNSLEIIKEYEKKDSRFIILNEPNEGAAISRKKGIDISKGDYIHLADSDDILDEKLLEETYKNAIKNNSDIVFFKANYFNTQNNSSYIPSKFDLSEFFPKDTNFNNFTFDWKSVKPLVFNRFSNVWCCLFNGDFLRENNFYFPKKLSFNDVPLHVQSILSAKKMSFVPKVLYNYRLINENSITFQSHKNLRIWDIFKITDFLEDFLKSKNLLIEFREEIINFKLDHYSYHLDALENQEILNNFFNEVKARFNQINLNEIEFNKLNGNLKVLFLSVIDSSLYSEYLTRKKIYNVKIRDFNDNINNVKVSVIIPVYNVEDFLGECLESVINQSLMDIEIICVNDGSTDNSKSILEKYSEWDDRIIVINQENCGLGCARNTGLSHAKGDFISFIDSDDFVSEETYELLYNNAILNNSDMVIFKIVRFTDSDTIYTIPDFPLENYIKGVDFNNYTFTYKDIKRFVLNASYSACAKFYRKEFFDSFDDFKFPVGVAYEDVIFHVKCLLRAKRISFIPKFFYHYRISNESSIMHTGSNSSDIFIACNLVEDFLNKSNNYDEFCSEFFLFKIVQLSQYILHSNSEDYFKRVKNEFQLMDLKGKNIPPQWLDRYNKVLSSNSLDDYQLLINGKIDSSNVKISVIIPVYNAEKYISKCLDSIINQPLKDIEVICVNDGSTDNSKNILKEYQNKDKRIKVIDKEHGGAGSARNVGLTYATGEYINFVDADDWISEDAYSVLYEKIVSEDLDLLLFQLINFDDVTKEYYETDYYNLIHIPSNLDNKVFNHLNIKDVLFLIPVSPCNKLFKKDIITNISFPEGLMFEDNPFFFEVLLKAKRMSILRKQFYHRRRHPNSTMSNNGKKFVDAIPISNLVFNIFKNSDFYDIYKNEVINFKCFMIKYWYDRINENDKSFYYSKIKSDFNKFISDKDLSLILENNILKEEYKSFYQNIINTDTFKEFILLDDFNALNSNYHKLNNDLSVLREELDSSKINNENLLNESKNLKNEINILNDKYNILLKENIKLNNDLTDTHIKFVELQEKFLKVKKLNFDNQRTNENLRIKVSSLKLQNDSLKSDLNMMKEFNEELLSSNSWKITKPLRNMRNLRK